MGERETSYRWVDGEGWVEEYAPCSASIAAPPTTWVEVQPCRIESVERAEPAYEVVVGSDRGDFSWGVWDDEATARNEAQRVGDMLEVVAP